MKHSTTCLILFCSFSALTSAAFAEEEGFDNFLLSSPSIISPSQFYQVKGGRFEAALGFINGSVDAKLVDFSTDVTGTQIGAGYAQALNSQVVLSADVDYASYKNDYDDGSSESTDTIIRPAVAFTLTPIFTLGASANITSGKEEEEGTSESYSYTNFTLGGTLHQDHWEGTVAVTTENKDEDKPVANSPQTLALHGRYKVMPVLTLGLGYEQQDYSGLDSEFETESSYRLVVESAFSEQAKIEVAFISTAELGGEKGADSTTIFLGGTYKVASNIELGAQATLMTAESDSSETSVNRFALTFTSRN